MSWEETTLSVSPSLSSSPTLINYFIYQSFALSLPLSISPFSVLFLSQYTSHWLPLSHSPSPPSFHFLAVIYIHTLLSPWVTFSDSMFNTIAFQSQLCTSSLKAESRDALVSMWVCFTISKAGGKRLLFNSYSYYHEKKITQGMDNFHTYL